MSPFGLSGHLSLSSISETSFGPMVEPSIALVLNVNACVNLIQSSSERCAIFMRTFAPKVFNSLISSADRTVLKGSDICLLASTLALSNPCLFHASLQLCFGKIGSQIDPELAYFSGLADRLGKIILPYALYFPDLHVHDVIR